MIWCRAARSDVRSGEEGRSNGIDGSGRTSTGKGIVSDIEVSTRAVFTRALVKFAGLSALMVYLGHHRLLEVPMTPSVVITLSMSACVALVLRRAPARRVATERGEEAVPDGNLGPLL